ncbi:MAG: M15 family metallopeptidase [Mycobacteriales bacterium]
MRPAAALVLAGLLSTGCAAGSRPPVAAPAPSRSRTLPSTPAAASPLSPADLAPSPSWRIGASPLPLRPDGFGEIQRTPEVLRDRRLGSVDVLPPPGGAFRATTGPVTTAVRTRMGETWSPACPVPLARLRYLTVSFHGFDGAAHTGELVVAARVAPQVVQAFGDLYAAGFPIEEMRLPTTADLRARPTGDGNNTAGYVCRAARGQTRFSAHAYGIAVDVNPFQNPEVKRDLVLPELASAYRDRSWKRPGMFLAGGPAVRAFTRIGWAWGGTWRSLKDPMHFSLNGQ